jgi:hypothetical protein
MATQEAVRCGTRACVSVSVFRVCARLSRVWVRWGVVCQSSVEGEQSAALPVLGRAPAPPRGRRRCSPPLRRRSPLAQSSEVPAPSSASFLFRQEHSPRSVALKRLVPPFRDQRSRLLRAPRTAHRERERRPKKKTPPAARRSAGALARAARAWPQRADHTRACSSGPALAKLKTQAGPKGRARRRRRSRSRSRSERGGGLLPALFASRPRCPSRRPLPPPQASTRLNPTPLALVSRAWGDLGGL